ncbi:MAG: GTPase Era [Bacillota bacterium]
MINIYYAKENVAVVAKATKAVLSHFNIDDNEVIVDIAVITEDEILKLNTDEREIAEVTDVLSFPMIDVKLPFNKEDYSGDIDPETGAVILGEIFICEQRAIEQAEEYNHSITREMGFLVTHSMLHLLGYDHMEEDDRKIMEAVQSEILEEASITRDIADNSIELDTAGIYATDEDEEEEVVAEESAPVKVGHVALVGRPNAGKSTLINALVGEKVAIVSWKPQTTRNRILGIMNTDDAQVVFVDTPGLHAPQNQLGKFMMRSVTTALADVDVVIYVVDGEKGVDKTDIENINRYINEASKKVIVVVNKIDHITAEKVGEILTILGQIQGIIALIPISALREKNITVLKEEVLKLLDYGKKEYEDDMYTDKSMRFMAAELIREKALRLLDKEVPYGIGVAINKYEVNNKGMLIIDADVICQKAAHKPIVLGKGGDMIKRISTYARQDLEAMTECKVFLTLWVRVKDGWRDSMAILDELGYNKDNY